MIYYITQDVPIQGGIITIDSNNVIISEHLDENPHTGDKYSAYWIKNKKGCDGPFIDRMIYPYTMFTSKEEAIADANARLKKHLQSITHSIARLKKDYKRFEGIAFDLD